jgi:hypothetical protein
MSDNPPVSVKTNPATVIHCAICLNTGKDWAPATTLISGYAVCAKHIELVSQPEFSIWHLHKRTARL